MFVINTENLKKLKYDILKNISVVEKTFKEEESIVILKFSGLINNTEEHNRIYNHA